MVEDFEFNYVTYRYEKRNSIPLQFTVQIHSGSGMFTSSDCLIELKHLIAFTLETSAWVFGHLYVFMFLRFVLVQIKTTFLSGADIFICTVITTRLMKINVLHKIKILLQPAGFMEKMLPTAHIHGIMA